MAAEIILPAVPFDSNEFVDSQGHITYDRVAYSADYAKWWKTYFSNGILINGGGNLTTEFQTTAKSGTTITVGAGNAVINGRTAWMEEDTDITLTANTTSSVRYDLICLELNIPNDRQIALKVYEGVDYTALVTNGTGLTQTDDVFQIPLSVVRVTTANALTIYDMRTRHKNWISNVNIGVNVPNDISDLPLTTETANVYYLSGANATYDKALYKNQAPYNHYVKVSTSKSWTVPANVNEIFVVAVGGGGGGGRGNEDSSTTYGSSGGGSGFVASAILKVQPGAIYSIVIGAGGVGGHESLYLGGGNGGTTSFGNFLFAAGGNGGQGASNSNSSASRGSNSGGAGGSACGYYTATSFGTGGTYGNDGESITVPEDNTGTAGNITLVGGYGLQTLLSNNRATRFTYNDVVSIRLARTVPDSYEFIFPGGGGAGGLKSTSVSEVVAGSRGGYATNFKGQTLSSSRGGDGGWPDSPNSYGISGVTPSLPGAGGGGGYSARDVAGNGGSGAAGAVYIYYYLPD